VARNGRFVRAQITRAGMVLAAVAGLAAAGLPVLPAGANGVGTVYVANEGSGSVSVIEHVGNTVLVTVPVGPAPRGVAVTPDGRIAFVANSGNGTVSAIDRDYYQVSNTTRVGKAPEAVVAPADATFSMVAEGPGSEIVTIDAVGARVKAVQVPGKPIALVANRSGSRAYVALEGNSNVYPVDDGDRVGVPIPMGNPVVAMALTSDGGTLYAIVPETNSLAIVETGSGKISASVPVGLTPLGLTIAPDGRIFVSNSISNDVTVVDPASRKAVATIAVGKRPVGIAIGPDGAFGYVANNQDNTVSVIDMARLEQSKIVNVGSRPIAIAVAPVQMVPATRPAGPAPQAQGSKPPSGAVVGGASEAVSRGTGASGPSVLPKGMPNTGDGSVWSGPDPLTYLPYAGAGIGFGLVLALVRRRVARTIPTRD